MKKKNLIVFDIDDTLTKSEYQHQKAYVDTMIDFGISEINQDWKSYENVTDSFILKENYEMNFQKKFDFSFIPDLIEASNTIFTRENIVKSAIEKAKNYFQVTTFEHIISVGDGIWDLKTARNLGIHFLGIRKKSLAYFQQEKIKSYITDWSEFNFDKIQSELGIK